MISLEKAKALRDAGLKWEPKKWDFYTMEPAEIGGVIINHGTYCINHKLSDLARSVMGDRIWLLSLSQLLAEIRQRGWGMLIHHNQKAYPAYSNRLELHKAGQASGGGDLVYWGISLEDAAADALLYLLEQEAKA